MFSTVRKIDFSSSSSSLESSSLDSPRSLSPTQVLPTIDFSLKKLPDSYPRSPLSPRELPLVASYFTERDDIPNHNGVFYIAADCLDAYKLRFNQQGQAIGYNDKPITSNKSVKKTSISLALVLNLDQTLCYIDLEKGKQHHSSLSSGQSVLWAAEVPFIKDGFFKIITDQSGHYRPNLRQFLYGLEQLKIMGADLRNTKIILNAFDEGLKQEFDNIKCEALLDLYIKNGFKNNKFIAVNTETLEEAKLHFINNQSEILSNTAVYFIKEVNDLYKLELSEDENLEPIVKATSYKSIYIQNNEQSNELSLASLRLNRSPVKPLILSSPDSSPNCPKAKKRPAAKPKNSTIKKLF